MSFEAKQVMLKDFKDGLIEKLTIAQVEEVMEVLSQKVNMYDIEIADFVDDEDEAIEYLNAYLSAKEVEGRSQKTIERYCYVIERFFKAIPVRPKMVTVYNIRKYLADLKVAGNSDRTLEGYRAVLNGFFGWLNNEGLIPNNPCANVSHIKYQKKVREALSNVDMERIWEVCDGQLDNGSRCTAVRDKALVSFLLSSGCRVSEVCMLDRDSMVYIIPTRELMRNHEKREQFPVIFNLH